MESVPKMKNCEKQTKVMPYKQLFFFNILLFKLFSWFLNAGDIASSYNHL